jgi:GNAT superfamily N-acetyltransferase
VSDIVIRKMMDLDVIAVSELVCAGYRQLSALEGYSTDEANRLCIERGSLKAITEQTTGYEFYVAEYGNDIVGIVAILNNIIEKLFVNPQMQRIGIGKALFNFAEDNIRRNGYKTVRLGSFPSSAGFYLSMGMERVSDKNSASGPIMGQKILIFEKELN